MSLTIKQMIGKQLPIFQAPIGSIASAGLVAAVCEAGGVGNLSCTWRAPDQLRAVVSEIHTLTDRPFGANFVLGFSFEDRLAIALDEGVRIISFFWGDASQYLADVKSTGAIAVQVVGSVAEAKRAADAGFDILVAQGREAGGHVRGNQGTISLIPEICDAVGSTPVLAAGGISDRRGVAAVFALGASGVWVGTRFLASTEANIHSVYQQAVIEAGSGETHYSELFNIGWPNAPLRTLTNSTVKRWQEMGCTAAPDRPDEGKVIASRSDGSSIPLYHYAAPTKEVSGDVEAMALYAGEGVGLVRKTQPAAEIVAELASGVPQRDFHDDR